MTASGSPAGGRRLLVATAVAHHTRQPAWDRPDLVGARNDVISLFTSEFGYTHLTELGLDPTRAQLTDQLRALCKQEVRPEDHLVIYFAGHGEILDASGEHVLLTSDTDPNDIEDALRTAELARKLLLGTPVQRLLLLLDTCYSGQGGNELAASALAGMQRDWDVGGGLVVLTSALPAEQAAVAAFPALLREAVDSLATAGYTPASLDIDAVVTSMNGSERRPQHQRIGWTSVGLTGRAPDFLPNPRHRPQAIDLDLYLQDVSDWDAQAEQRDLEYRRRFLIRAMGGRTEGNSWWFSGRRAALTDIATWLHERPPDRPGLAVTGGPGSGKTAVLGLVATLNDPDRRRTVPLYELDLPPAANRFHDALDVSIYAGALSRDQVLAGLAAAAQVHATTASELVGQLAARKKPLVALIDALDEAADPRDLITNLIAPLLRHQQNNVRLLLGTRPHLLPLLSSAVQKLDLDDEEYADPAAMTTYTARGLLEGAEDSPYLDAPPKLIRDVAAAVSDAAMPSFLVARIVSTTLAAEASVPDPTDPAWRASLPTLPGDAMRADLDRRLGPDAQRARDLLRPLAYAQGQGLPWENIWAPLASAISGRSYTDEDLLWLRRAAGSYVVEATEAGRSAYRLYHQALAEHLRQDIDQETVESAFLDTLRKRVPPRIGGGRDWSRAHPYTLTHLATHADGAGRIDSLITDTEYLVYADPGPLELVIRKATSPTGRLVRTAYLASAGIHRDTDPATRRDILAIDAVRCGASHELAALNEPPHWAVRWATGEMVNEALRATLTGHQGVVASVACTVLNDAPVAVTGGSDQTVRIWDLVAGAQRALLTGHREMVVAVDCTVLDDTPIAVTASWDSTLRVWNLATGSQLAVLTGHDGHVDALACTELRGRPVVVSGGWDKTLRVWDLARGSQLAVLTGHDEPVGAVACIDLDGVPVAVSGSQDQTVRMWSLITGSQLAVFAGHDFGVTAVDCIELHGRPVAVSGGDKTIRIWDLITRKEHAVLRGHEYAVWAMACTELADGPIAISSAYDETVRVWDLNTGAQRAQLPGHELYVRDFAFTTVDNSPAVVTVSNDASVRLWDLTADSRDPVLPGHGSSVNAVACTEVDAVPVAVTVSSDATARVWELSTGVQRSVLAGHDSLVDAVACSSLNGAPVAVTGSWDNTVRVWDLRTGAQRGVLTGHSSDVRAVACIDLHGSPTAVSAGDDCTVRVWDLATNTQRALLTGHDSTVYALACTHLDGVPVAVSADFEGVIRVWDLIDGTARTVFPAAHWIHALACTEVGGVPVAVSGNFDHTVGIWDLRTGRRRATLTGHGSLVAAVACSELDGQPVAITGSGDHTVRVWDLETHQTVDGHAAPYQVNCLAVARAGVMVVGAGRELIRLDLPTRNDQRPVSRDL